MSIDWLHFTAFPALVGGMLIGLAAGSLILLTGRITGISGILGGLLRANAGPAGWRVAFLAGLIASPWIYRVFASPAPARVDANWPVLAIAGLLVGVGTRYGAGCTSGHGICGLSRLSLRSLVAVAIFMAAGFLTVFVVRHVPGG